MASMLMMKQMMNNTILRSNSVSKPQLHSFSSSFSSLSHRVSRVSFSSASKFDHNRYPTSDAGAEADAKAEERHGEAVQGFEDDGRAAERAAEETKNTMRSAKEKTKEGAGKAAEAMHNVGERAKEKAKGAWETTKEAAQRVKESVVGDDDDRDKRPEQVMEDMNLPRFGDARDAEIRDQSKL